MELSPQAANNRLRQLTKAGALQRERINPAHGGREFRYSVPVAA
jgi:predicted transcriptional regulator